MRRVWLALIIASLGWGTAGVATRATLNQGLEPFALSALRSGLGLVTVIGFLVATRAGLPKSAAAWKVGLVMGVSNLAVPYILSTIALQYASAGFLGLTTALIPLFTAIIAHFYLTDERLTPLKVTGLAIGLGGVAMLLTSGDSGLAGGGRPVLAGFLALISVASIALGGVFAKRHSGQYRSLEVTGVHFATGAAVIFIAMLVAEGMPATITPRAWVLLLYMGILSTFLPFVLYYWMLQSVSATFASIAGYLVPPVAVVTGIILLDERLQTGIVVGGLLILAGVLITDRSERLLRRGQ